MLNIKKKTKKTGVFTIRTRTPSCTASVSQVPGILIISNSQLPLAKDFLTN